MLKSDELLSDNVGKPIFILLENNLRYEGILISYDAEEKLIGFVQSKKDRVMYFYKQHIVGFSV